MWEKAQSSEVLGCMTPTLCKLPQILYSPLSPSLLALLSTPCAVYFDGVYIVERLWNLKSNLSLSFRPQGKLYVMTDVGGAF